MSTLNDCINRFSSGWLSSIWSFRSSNTAPITVVSPSTLLLVIFYLTRLFFPSIREFLRQPDLLIMYWKCETFPHETADNNSINNPILMVLRYIGNITLRIPNRKSQQPCWLDIREDVVPAYSIWGKRRLLILQQEIVNSPLTLEGWAWRAVKVATATLQLKPSSWLLSFPSGLLCSLRNILHLCFLLQFWYNEVSASHSSMDSTC